MGMPIVHLSGQAQRTRNSDRRLARATLLIVAEISHLPVFPGGGNLFFQRVNARYEKGLDDPDFEPPCSMTCCTTPSSSKSKARATGCASTPKPRRKSPHQDRWSIRRHRQNGATVRLRRKVDDQQTGRSPTVTLAATPGTTGRPQS
jgi:hypothetical protein